MFEYEEGGDIVLKGFPEPVTIYRVLGEARAQSRFDARASVPQSFRRPRAGTRRAPRPVERGGAGGGQIVLLSWRTWHRQVAPRAR